jgi:hypothetical protein
VSPPLNFASPFDALIVAKAPMSNSPEESTEKAPSPAERAPKSVMLVAVIAPPEAPPVPRG